MGSSKKFTDEDDTPVSVRVRQEVAERENEDSGLQSVEEDESSEESSDDEAPEEEAVSTLLRSAKETEEARLKIEREQKLLEKLKRREQSLKYQRQQEEKKKQQKSLPEESDEEDDIPDFLPLELLEDVELPKEDSKSKKHINFDEDPREIRKLLKKQRLQQLKQLQKLRDKSVKKGPVTVSVLKTNNKVVNNKRILSVPVGEGKVINKRDKWLKRKSLGKV